MEKQKKFPNLFQSRLWKLSWLYKWIDRDFQNLLGKWHLDRKQRHSRNSSHVRSLFTCWVGGSAILVAAPRLGFTSPSSKDTVTESFGSLVQPWSQRRPRTDACAVGAWNRGEGPVSLEVGKLAAPVAGLGGYSSDHSPWGRNDPKLSFFCSQAGETSFKKFFLIEFIGSDIG